MKRFKGKPKDLITPDRVGFVMLRYLREHKHRRAARRIAENPAPFIAELYKDLAGGTYKHAPMTQKTIGGRGEKLRHISIPRVRDAIAAQVVFDVLEDWWYRHVYNDTYCNRRKFGGTLLFKRLHRFVKRKKPKYALKADVRKCFESVRHDVIISLLECMIKSREMRDLIMEAASIRPGGLGLPIGNGLSHHLANALLGNCFYARLRKVQGVMRVSAYMDDFLVFANNKRKLHRARVLCEVYLKDVDLRLKNNWQVYLIPVEGVDIVGYRFWTNGRVRVRRKIYRRAVRAQNPKRMASYYGFAKHARDFKLMTKLKQKKGC